MFHGLTNQFLYSAYRIVATFADDIGNVKRGVGTCFFVQNRRGELALVTNRHILDYSYKNSNSGASNYSLRAVDVSGKLAGPPDNFPVHDLSFGLSPIAEFHPDNNNDVACISRIAPTNASTVRIDYFVPYSFVASAADFERRLSVCDFLAFPGFPEWHDRKGGRPILRTGTISSDPRFDYSYSDLVSGSCLAYEAFSYGGSSGSPVFAVQKGPKPGPGISFPDFRDLLLVGINAGHLKVGDKSHSGISYLYKSTTILDLIDS